jgi:hypothetical protein
VSSKVNLDVITFYDILIHKIDQVNNRLAILKHTAMMGKTVQSKIFRTRLKAFNQILRPLTKTSRTSSTILPITVQIPANVSSQCKALYTNINTKTREFLKGKTSPKHYSRVVNHTVSQFKLIQKQLKKRCLRPFTL